MLSTDIMDILGLKALSVRPRCCFRGHHGSRHLAIRKHEVRSGKPTCRWGYPWLRREPGPENSIRGGGHSAGACTVKAASHFDSSKVGGREPGPENSIRGGGHSAGACTVKTASHFDSSKVGGREPGPENSIRGGGHSAGACTVKTASHFDSSKVGGCEPGPENSIRGGGHSAGGCKGHSPSTRVEKT